MNEQVPQAEESIVLTEIKQLPAEVVGEVAGRFAVTGVPSPAGTTSDKLPEVSPELPEASFSDVVMEEAASLVGKIFDGI